MCFFAFAYAKPDLGHRWDVHLLILGLVKLFWWLCFSIDYRAWRVHFGCVTH